MTAFSRLIVALGLATASLIAADPAPAAACGGYVMNPEDLVLGLAWEALTGEPGARAEALRWQDDGSVEVEVRWATYRPGTETAQYLYFAIDDRGQWAMDRHSDKFTVWRDASGSSHRFAKLDVVGRQATDHASATPRRNRGGRTHEAP